MSYIKIITTATLISGSALFAGCSQSNQRPSTQKEYALRNYNYYVTTPREDSLKQIENKATTYSYSKIKSGLKKAFNALKDSGEIAAKHRY